MRTVASWGLLLGLVVAPLYGQTTVRITFAFEGEPRPSTTEPEEVGSILARRDALKAWTDSVDVYLDQVALAARNLGWVRARRREQADYRVAVTALPVLAGNAATGMTAYSLVVFEPDAADWKYVQNYVGYGMSAQQAAGGIFRAAVDAINARRSGGGRAPVAPSGQSAGAVVAIANEQPRIDPLKFVFYRFDLPTGTCTVVGKLQGTAGGALDFEAIITDSDGLQNWRTSHSARVVAIRACGGGHDQRGAGGTRDVLPHRQQRVLGGDVEDGGGTGCGPVLTISGLLAGQRMWASRSRRDWSPCILNSCRVSASRCRKNALRSLPSDRYRCN